MLVDSHCHLDMLCAQQQLDIADVIAEAKEQAVEHMLCVSVSLERFAPMMELIEPWPQVSASVGVHPDGRDVEEPGVERLVALAQSGRIVAIGETGLDYFRSEGDLEWQRERFRCHIRAARQVGKPLIVHTRAAREDTLAILREEQAGEVGGVMHCFTEDWDTARAAMDLGFHISFSGIVTFKNAVDLKDVARKVPAERMLVETDSPYLAPVPRRGKPNRPAWVRHVAEYLAELRGEPLERLADYTTRNFHRLFSPAAR
ncbi:MAG TPA: TatD family deoxyribonuclease [Gammaproteobacteria bacterium]|nr:TatD family deoxyribonuclease [Gammaproteobacteria bacterium]